VSTGFVDVFRFILTDGKLGKYFKELAVKKNKRFELGLKV